MRPAGEPRLFQRQRQGEEGCDTAGGDEVMAARMTNSRQSIIFRVEVDQATTTSTPRLEGRIETVSMTGDIKALLFKEVTYGFVGSVLFVGGFGVRPDLNAELIVSEMSSMLSKGGEPLC